MTQKHIPSRAELIQRTLDTRRHQEEADLFNSNTSKTPFWKLSELAILYPSIFNPKNPISPQTANKIALKVTDAVPEFRKLTERPVHILTIKETYNIYNPTTNRIETVKNGTNQYLTNVACEYLFRQQKDTELEQAYFLYPNKDAAELETAANELKFEKIRTHIAQTSNLLSAIINRANGATKSSFHKTWSLIWETFYNVKSMEELRTQYNIKTSPIDYMKLKTLVFINAMLQEIVFNFANKSSYNLADVHKHAQVKAAMARAEFFKYKTTPEEQLIEKSSYYTLERIRNARKRFWLEHYPISLPTR